ncbi:penicillin-binding transpeptidase domain-containing protein [Nocardiopsis lucentensis]|uniref:penicillin-binding transpeptidase domain-containing protein n=1 Tax=Nocardiopsis lucentensis TaxID=53441 RepID=UPI000361603E|nr:penicillin-binding transpeptidase domain-containing protein [Nocardiopsis lucentensis]
MDDWSPRQPGSPGPPEGSDDTRARGARPENPYRIPRRSETPPTPEPDHPGLPNPVAPPETHQAPRPPQGPDDSWDVPVPQPHPVVPEDSPAARAEDSWAESGWGDPRPDEAHRAEPPHQGVPAHGGDTPYPIGVASHAEPDGWTPERTERGWGPEAPRSRDWSGAAPAGPGYDDDEYPYGGGSGGPGVPDGPGGPGGPYGPGVPDGPDAFEPPKRRSRKGLVIGVVAAVAVLALIGGAVSWFVLGRPRPEEALTAYAAAWEERDYAGLAAVTTGGDAAAVMEGLDAGLGLDTVSVEVGAATVDGGDGSAPYEVTVTMSGASDWGWEGELPLVREDGQWLVDFTPEVAYPGLGEGQVLARTTVWGERGRILAADGTQMDAPGVSGSLQMLTGSLGEATEEDVERLRPAYSVGDTIGVSGLQRTYEERLAGEAATTILMVDAAAAEDPASLEATEDNTVATLDGSDGQDVTTSIDMAVQEAAATAILTSDDPAGMVAVRPSTGEILAVVNVPGGFNRAFEGRYPPGSALKIISYSALLDAGMTTDTTMQCPEEYNPGGWAFVNAGGAGYGAQTMTEAFATSCNTALVAGVVERLSSEDLVASAEQFGMNAPLDIGVPNFDPSFPAPDGAVMMGAQSIGQGQVESSPLHMATVPAAIADGSWRHPVLVTDPARDDLPEPNPIANAESIRPMMRAVVTDGTARDAGFQGEVYGKTGSAEYGTPEGEDDELPTHAWMVGYKADVAFALVVDGGGGGGSVAGPIAAMFTNAL